MVQLPQTTNFSVSTVAAEAEYIPDILQNSTLGDMDKMQPQHKPNADSVSSYSHQTHNQRRAAGYPEDVIIYQWDW